MGKWPESPQTRVIAGFLLAKSVFKSGQKVGKWPLLFIAGQKQLGQSPFLWTKSGRKIGPKYNYCIYDTLVTFHLFSLRGSASRLKNPPKFISGEIVRDIDFSRNIETAELCNFGDYINKLPKSHILCVFFITK